MAAYDPNPSAITVTHTYPVAEFSPEMLALPTDMMRRFVIEVLEAGGTNYSACAGRAGYKGDSDQLKVTAYRLAHDPRIQAAIREEGRRRLTLGVGVGVAFLHEVISNNTVSTKDRLRAVELVFNRTGLPAVTEQKIDVVHTVSDKEMLQRINQLAEKYGLDPMKLIGDSTTIEAEPIPQTAEDWTAA